MSLEIFIQISLVCLIGAMSPGPSMLVVTSNAIFKSKIDGFLTALGHGIGISFYAFLAVSGLGFLINTGSIFFQVLQILSIIFLIYLGIKTMLSKDKLNLFEPNIASKNISFLQGFGISIFNPKIVIWFIAIYSQFMGIENDNFYNLILIITAGVIDTIWYVLLTLLVTSRFILSYIQKKINFFGKIIGIFFIIIGLILLINLTF